MVDHADADSAGSRAFPIGSQGRKAAPEGLEKRAGLAGMDYLLDEISDLDASGAGKNTKASQLVERLRQAILLGELEPGSKINLDTTRRKLGVSLSPLREALARLVSVGLVELHDNRGYTVAPVSQENLAEIIKLRAELETFALAEAIRNGDTYWESAVIRSLHKLNRMTTNPGDPESIKIWERAHREFHQTLLSGCNMPLLMNFCTMLHNLSDRYRRDFLMGNANNPGARAEHNEIGQGAVARDLEFACGKLRTHIERTGRLHLDRLDEGRE